MDTQLSGAPNLDDEWAVKQILSHARSGTDATFKIKWKARDITWLPYYQITHLDALTEYFDLIGVSKVSKLPQGKGTPLSDDPQIFVGPLSPFVFTHQPSPFHSIKPASSPLPNPLPITSITSSSIQPNSLPLLSTVRTLGNNTYFHSQQMGFSLSLSTVIK